VLTDEELRVMIDKRMGRDVMDYEGASFSLRSLADEIYDKACDDCAKACDDKDQENDGQWHYDAGGLAHGADICLSLKHQTLDSGGSDETKGRRKKS